MHDPDAAPAIPKKHLQPVYFGVKMNLSAQWLFSRENAPGHFRKIPNNSIVFELPDDSHVNIDAISGVEGKLGDECLIFNRFELDDDTPLGFGAGADWWFECFLNGKKIYSTFPNGNGSAVFSCDDHNFAAMGRKGENLLTFHLRRGAAGSWTFCCCEKDARIVDPCAPLLVTVEPSHELGPIKIMNAVNNGPIKERSDQTRGNMRFWKAAGIPFARNHDAAFCAAYGGEHCVDVHNIFPDFSRDPEDPASYDFTLTDIYIETTFEGGTETFYRLGSKIEHAQKKYGTQVPPDFKKWAVICEHIIRHYNEGWAGGFNYNLRYWEIWNEPDLSSGQTDKKTWQGTDEEFFEFYCVAASHLKKCFPALKIGGPAVAGRTWIKNFLAAISGKEEAPLDFFSWHIYTPDPRTAANSCREIRRILDSFGRRETESILDEWNYIRGWGDEFVYSIKTIIGMKGAAFTAAVMAACQSEPVDMLMYYDARPGVFNGLFDFYTLEPLKTYYVFRLWARLAELGRQIEVDTEGKNGIYAVGASGPGGGIAVMVSRYFETDTLPGELPVTLAIPEQPDKSTKLYMLDNELDLEEIPFKRDNRGFPCFTMKPNSVAFLEQR